MIMPKAPGAAGAGETYRSRRRRPDVVRASLLAGGWLIVAVLGLVALLRLVAPDSAEPLIVLDALTVVVYLPAWVVAIGALIRPSRPRRPDSTTRAHAANLPQKCSRAGSSQASSSWLINGETTTIVTGPSPATGYAIVAPSPARA